MSVILFPVERAHGIGVRVLSARFLGRAARSLSGVLAVGGLAGSLLACGSSGGAAPGADSGVATEDAREPQDDAAPPPARTHDSGAVLPDAETHDAGGRDPQSDANEADVMPDSSDKAPGVGVPQLSFTDLVSGSGSGGDNGSGAYVTVFGVNLSESGSITVGGQPAVTGCAHCTWSSTKIVFQLGSGAASGDIKVSTSAGTSNGLPFTVTPTTYYFISPSGSDSNAGTFVSPYATLRHFLDTNAPITRNTVVYLMDGLNLTGNDGRGWNSSASVDSGGLDDSNRLNIVAYPGAHATIGAPDANAQYGMFTYSDYVTVAGLSMRGYSAFSSAPSVGYLRFVGNDVSCQQIPAAFGDNACVFFSSGSSSGASANYTEFLGNTVHDTGSAVADKTYHAVYFGTDMNNSEIGWNTIGTGVFYGYCRSILLHSSPDGNTGSGKNLYGYEIHDNFIQKGWCDGIGLASVDPSKGAINVYDNVIVNTGVSSDGTTTAPPDGNNVGIAINTDDEGPSSGAVNIYSNTLYNAGVYSAFHSNGCFGVLDTGATAKLTSNVCYQTSPLPYIETAAGGAINGGYSGSHNLWYGSGPAPSWDSGSLNVNPQLSNPSDLTSVAGFVTGLTVTPAVGAPVVDGVLF